MCKFCFRKWETSISEERVEFFKSINGNYIWQKTFNWKFKYKDTKVHCYRYRSVNELTDTIIVSHVRKSKLGIQMFIEATSMDEVTKVDKLFFWRFFRMGIIYRDIWNCSCTQWKVKEYWKIQLLTWMTQREGYRGN